jgi:AraC-like DNA-binding protein
MDALQIEQFEGHNCQTFCSLQKHDVEKIYEAKSFVERHLNEPCSLLELSRHVGINDFKLKKEFKEIFGTTVFGYLNDLRMEEARRMLSEENRTINEVAKFVGYKNQTHFTVAFKKKYGILPRYLKKG